MTATLDPPPISSFRLAWPEATPRLPLSDAPRLESLTRKHRPRTLDDVVGQGAAVLRLQTFLECPHSHAFLFEGPTGVGKTSTALALAAGLGVEEPSPDLVVIESGRQNGDAVEWILDLFRFPPMYGGFRVVVVNEADMMTPAAEKLWLSGLESIPARTVVIFTTNRADRFEPRFFDRFESVPFASDGAMLRQDAQTLVDSIWLKETGRTDAPRVDGLPNMVDKNGCISFRRCVAALDPMIRAAIRSRPGGHPSAPTVAFRARHGPATGPTGDDGRGIPGAAPTSPRAPTARRKPAPPVTLPAPLPSVPIGGIEATDDPGDDPAAIRCRLAAIERELETIGLRAWALNDEEEELRRRLGPARRRRR